MTEQNKGYQWFLERAKLKIVSFVDVHTLGFGDAMLDIYWRSSVERPNPECDKGYDLLNPKKTQSAGGAANVAVNIGSLRGNCSFVGVVGRDVEASTLVGLLDNQEGVSFDGIVDSGRPTTSKTRFCSKKGIARISFESLQDINGGVAQQCIQALARVQEQSGALWIGDYGKGVIQPDLITYLVELRLLHPNLPIVFDPKTGHGGCYRSGMCSVLKPNWAEACDMLGLDSKTADRNDVVKKLSKKFDCDVVVTLGGDGSIVHEKQTGKTTLVPTRAEEDRDVTGAGDTIVATLALALATRMTLVEATVLANCAAGVVVRKQGTASVTPEELLVELSKPEMQEIISDLFQNGALKAT